jgi:hypothetical protein
VVSSTKMIRGCICTQIAITTTSSTERHDNTFNALRR